MLHRRKERKIFALVMWYFKYRVKKLGGNEFLYLDGHDWASRSVSRRKKLFGQSIDLMVKTMKPVKAKHLRTD